MGVALARQAQLRGADVTLVHAPLEVDPPYGVTCIAASTADNMMSAMLSAQPVNDIVLMAAAVADWQAAEISEDKLVKVDGQQEWQPLLRRTPDILLALGEAKPEGQLLVGFAAETDLDFAAREESASRKLKEKKCDAIVLNQVGDGVGFGEVETVVTLITASPQSLTFEGTKSSVAGRLLDALPEL
jgi:phosphopantothenoylcysteine decarboxylase/phosphopantothenate--cysteine ligase